MSNRMLAAALVAGIAAAAGTAAAPADARTTLRVSPRQEVAKLLTGHKVLSAIHDPSRVTRIAEARPITGGQTVLPVVAHGTRNGAHWLRVELPGRPNGAKGWIAQRGTVLVKRTWHLVVRTSTRRLRVYRTGHFVRSFPVIVGSPSTPTPHGRFFVEEAVRMLSGSAGAPFALALSARSTVLQEFAGGPGQIALHGLANIGGTLGTAVSHGCVRLADRSISWLAARIAPGVPVTITR
jgi:lipoprotein-anchoring transpeptidase ErfK/SrfK